MKFKIDENLPAEVAELLRQSDHDATTVLGENLGGTTDPNIASICQHEDRALVTLDTDFADIRAYPPTSYPGLIVLRLSRQDKAHVLDAIKRIVPLLEQEPLKQLLWIVDESRIRIRGAQF